jgi:hypothetical protein
MVFERMQHRAHYRVAEVVIGEGDVAEQPISKVPLQP